MAEALGVAEAAQVATRASSPAGSVPTTHQQAGGGSGAASEGGSITGSPPKRARLAPPPEARQGAHSNLAFPMAAADAPANASNVIEAAPGAGAGAIAQLGLLGNAPAPAAYGGYGYLAGGGLPAASGMGPAQAQQGRRQC